MQAARNWYALKPQMEEMDMDTLPHERMKYTRRIYTGKVLNLRRDTAQFPSGKETVREVVEHKGAVAIAAVDDDRNIYLVQQYRYAFDDEFLELPAGKLDSEQEIPLDAAHRELREETGLRADSMEYLGYICPSVAICTEKIHIFLARGLHMGECDPDEDEFLNVITMPLDELYALAGRGGLRDAKTLCALTLLLGKL